ncbi:MAG: ADP-glyceromanno-heptose 6-epimerase [Opitutaceae bacterium]|nr:ADP-glyceromanno-heptose 6-epimerase [Opitutaceae bacterium]
MKSPIIVTGASGFIGANIVRELNARGCTDLILVDSLGTDEKWKNLRGLAYEDLLAPDDFLARCEDGRMAAPDAVIHLGACSATTESNAGFLLRNNYRYTRRLCEWTLGHGARFVYASSAATYGDGSQGYDDDTAKLDTLRPLNMYGYSKHMFDQWALRHGLFDRIVGLKYFNVYGPYEDHKGDMRSLVNKSHARILEHGNIELFASDRPDYRDGEQKRDFIYVKDVVDMTLHFAEHRDGGGLFNCGTGIARTWLDLARALFAAMGRTPNIRFIPMPDVLRGKYQYFTQANMTKMRAAGYTKPFTTLEDGIRDYVQNYLLTLRNT